MKVTAKTTLRNRAAFEQMGDALEPGLTRFQQVARQQQFDDDVNYPRACYQVRIVLDPDEQPAYDFVWRDHKYRPREIKLTWGLGAAHGWKLREVDTLTSLVLKKTGKPSEKNGCVLVRVFGPGRYDAHDPAEIPELFRPFIIEHAPRPLRGPDEERPPRDTTEIGVGERVQIRRTPFESTWPGFFGLTGTVMDTSPGDRRVVLGNYGVVIYHRDQQFYDTKPDDAWQGENPGWWNHHEVHIGPEEYGVVFDGDECGYVYWFRRRQLDRLP
jgi:hypothetical protein